MLIMTNLHSQVYHREYYSTIPGTLKATSSAFVILDTANTALLFKSDGKRIEVIPIDANTMATISPSAIYSLTPTPIYDIYLTNAFLDDSGDVVLYGYAHDSYMNRGMMLKYDPSTASHFTFMFMQYGGGKEIVSGCWGYDPNGVMNYAFVDKDGYLFTTDVSFNITYHALQPKYGKFTHVTYDSYNKVYLGSGWCKNDPISVIFAKIHTDMTTGVIYRYNKSDLDIVNGRTMHIQTDEQTAFLCQDFKDSDNHNHIWMASINLTNCQIMDAELVPFKLDPITLIDISYNKNDKRAILLGRADYCPVTDGKNFLMQENPYDLKHQYSSSVDCSLLTEPIYDFPCPGYPDANQIHLSQISYNKYRKMFFSSGVNFRKPEYLYSIELSNVPSTYNCDFKIPCYPKKAIPEREDWKALKYEMLVEKPFNMNIDNTLNPINKTHCFNQEHIPDNRDELRSVQSQEESQNIVVTNVMGEQQFVCHDFKGNCSYQLYDFAGRLIASGNTVNGQSNKIPEVSKGIYILKVVDDNHTVVSKKIVVQ